MAMPLDELKKFLALPRQDTGYRVVFKAHGKAWRKSRAGRVRSKKQKESTNANN